MSEEFVSSLLHASKPRHRWTIQIPQYRFQHVWPDIAGHLFDQEVQKRPASLLRKLVQHAEQSQF